MPSDRSVARWCRRAMIALLGSLAFLGNLSAQEPSAPAPVAPKAAAPAPGPTSSIEAVLPVALFNKCRAEMTALFVKAALPPARAGCQLSDLSKHVAAEPTLVGAGDVVVVVANWTEPAAGSKLRIWLNGVDVTDDVAIIGAEHPAGYAFLTLRLMPGKQSRVLWSTLIRNAGLAEIVALSVGLSWNGSAAPAVVNSAMSTLPTTPPTSYTATIAVTTTTRLLLAGGLVLLFGGAALALALRYGVLKDDAPAEIADLLAEAARLRRACGASGGAAASRWIPAS